MLLKCWGGCGKDGYFAYTSRNANLVCIKGIEGGDMPRIRCVECGQQIEIDLWSTPYDGELSCPNCGIVMQVHVTTGAGTTVQRKYPSFDELKGIWEKLSDIEKKIHL